MGWKSVIDTHAVLKFITEEVTRQGYDVKDSVGLNRIGNMVIAWADAVMLAKEGETPDVAAVISFGRIMEPAKNTTHSFRSVGVRVGPYVAPPPGEVMGLMRRWERAVRSKDRHELLAICCNRSAGGSSLFEVVNPSFADIAYVAFETIHPFVDGNGRVGKILHNWLNGTLHDPVLVRDYFGGGNP